ncbi:MAG TPA: hypothetical protein VFO76_01130 [Candidatus Kapabacteria bacterium]|nr:hypothetical protein [Candidatus Kapabacteria bacterium]
MKWYKHISLVLLTVLAFSGCQNNLIDVNPPVAGTVDSYAWKTNIPLQYTVEANNTTSTITLQFTKTNEPNEYLVNQSINGNTLSLHLVSNQDSMSISGLNPYSVIPVPPDYVMTKTKFDTSFLFPSIKHIIGVGSTFVASDSVSVYYLRDNHWIRSTSLQQQVTAFSRWGMYVAAATSGGNLFFSADSGKNWTSSDAFVKKNWSGTITALYFDGASLYFAAGSTIFVLSPNQQLTNAAGGRHFSSAVTSIARYIPNSSDSLLLIGTESNGLYYYVPGDSARHFEFGPKGNEAIHFITTSTAAQTIVVGSSSGLYSTSTRDSFDFIDARQFVRGIYDDKFFVIDNSGFLYILSSGQANPFALPSGLSRINDIASSLGRVELVSDQGIYLSSNSGNDWLHDSTLALQKINSTTIASSMHLLVQALDTGKVWHAGTLEFGGKLLDLTAKVVDYFDSIKLTNGITFSSVYAVTYTLTDSAGLSQVTFPEWTIYYAKGEGPILIDERRSGKLESRIYRSTR